MVKHNIHVTAFLMELLYSWEQEEQIAAVNKIGLEN